jgi:choline dehydrogenase
MLEACRSLGLPVFDDQNGAREEGEQRLCADEPDHSRRPPAEHGTFVPVPGAVAQKRDAAGQHARRSPHLLPATVPQASRSAAHQAHAASRPRRSDPLLGGHQHTQAADAQRHRRRGLSCAAQGIKTLVHAPEVGKNFQDHLLHGGCIWEPKEHIPHRNSAANAAGFVKSQASLASPDVNLVQIELPYASDVVGKRYSPPNTSWALCAGPGGAQEPRRDPPEIGQPG